MSPLPTEAILVDRIAALEARKNAVAAEQASAILEFARAHGESQISAGLVEPEELERSIAAQAALACRVSPTEGRKRLRVARDLRDGHDHVRDLYAAGELSEHKVATIVRATAHLSSEERTEVDQALAEAKIENLGVRRIGDLARKLAAQVAPEKFEARCRTARASRYVSVRPAADGMAYLTAHLAAEQAIVCLGALAKHVNTVAISPELVTRDRGQIMADTLVERITGQATAADVNVEVQVIVPIEALLDPTSPLPAEIPGYGPVPLDRILADSDGAKAIRRLLSSDGIVIGGDSRQRAFTGSLAAFLRARDGNRCREPYCDAPLRHFDHILRWVDGGRTEFGNGRGLCAFHNHVREGRGWSAKAVNEKTITTTTPTGHTYASTVIDAGVHRARSGRCAPTVRGGSPHRRGGSRRTRLRRAPSPRRP